MLWTAEDCQTQPTEADIVVNTKYDFVRFKLNASRRLLIVYIHTRICYVYDAKGLVIVVTRVAKDDSGVYVLSNIVGSGSKCGIRLSLSLSPPGFPFSILLPFDSFITHPTQLVSCTISLLSSISPYRYLPLDPVSRLFRYSHRLPI